jgi:hypothetical protein
MKGNFIPNASDFRKSNALFKRSHFSPVCPSDIREDMGH